MQPISWVDVIGIIILPIVGYILMKINSLQRELSEHKVTVATGYVPKDDFNNALNKIDVTLANISDKLDKLSERRQHDRGEQ